jgi:hypothetical protein
MLTQDNPELLLAFQRTRALARLHDIPRKIIHHLTADGQAFGVGAMERTREEYEGEVHQRVTTYFQALIDKTKSGPPVRLSSVISQTKGLVEQLASQWGSGKPMNAKKAVALSESKLLQAKQVIVRRDLDSALRSQGVFDILAQTSRDGLPPEQRLSLFIRTKALQAPATDSQHGTNASTARVRSEILKQLGQLQLGPDRSSTVETPTYAWGKSRKDAARQHLCRNLLQQSSTIPDLEEGVRQLVVSTTDPERPVCRDEAGRFSSGCTTEERREWDFYRTTRNSDKSSSLWQGT